MNVEIGTEARIFLFWEYLFQIFGILSLQCGLGVRYKTAIFKIIRMKWEGANLLPRNLPAIEQARALY